MKLTKVELRKMIMEELVSLHKEEDQPGEEPVEGGRDVEKISAKMDAYLGNLWGLINNEKEFAPLMKKFLESATASGKVTPTAVKRTLLALAKEVSKAP